MKITHFLLSLVVAVGSSAVAAQETQVAEVSFKNQMINQAHSFVETTANALVAPFVSNKDVECLARNIFYEAGSEPLEGKVAVGLVTMNRAQDPRYPAGICGVVQQKTLAAVSQKVTTVRTVKPSWVEPPRQVVETRTQTVTRAICQFSWTCMRVSTPKNDDPRWIESQQVAEELAHGGYYDLQLKYSDAMNFHNIYVHPGWRLKRIGRVGNHIFYEGPPAIGG